MKMKMKILNPSHNANKIEKVLTFICLVLASILTVFLYQYIAYDELTLTTFTKLWLLVFLMIVNTLLVESIINIFYLRWQNKNRRKINE